MLKTSSPAIITGVVSWGLLLLLNASFTCFWQPGVLLIYVSLQRGKTLSGSDRHAEKASDLAIITGIDFPRLLVLLRASFASFWQSGVLKIYASLHTRRFEKTNMALFILAAL